MVLLPAVVVSSGDDSSSATATASKDSSRSKEQQQQQQQHDDDDDAVKKEKTNKKKNDASSSNGSNRKSDIVIHKTRVRDDLDYVGTVVYVGPVASSKDLNCLYAGIVWDDASRGKHNGTVVCRRTKRLVRHFDCSVGLGPTAASFIKLSKLDMGRLLTPEILLERYVPLHSKECIAPNDILPHTACTSSGRNDKPIQFLGEMQIRQHLQVPNLHHWSLRRCGIRGMRMDTHQNNSTNIIANDWSSLFQKHHHQHGNYDNTVKKLTHLDLAGNLLSDWQSVGEILNVLLAALPQSCCALDTLNLSWNRLGDYYLPSSSSSSVISTAASTASSSSSSSLLLLLLSTNTTLTTINLQACHIQRLETLMNLGRSWTHLQELVLAKCNFSNVCCKQQNHGYYYQQNYSHEHSLTTTRATATTLVSTSTSSSSSPRVMNQSQQETTTTRGISANNGNHDDDDDDVNNNNNNHDDDYSSSRSSIIDMDLLHFYQYDLAQHFMHLVRLDLSSCQLHSPAQVLVFSRLPLLESLSLDDNPFLSSLPCRTCSMCNDGGGGGGGSSSTCLLAAFPALRHLQLAGTNISDWTTGLDDFFLGCRDCRVRAMTNNAIITRSGSCIDTNDDVDDEDSATASRSTLPSPPPPLQSLRFRSTPLSERLGAAATRVTLIARYGSASTAAAAGSSSPREEQQQQQQSLSVINATVVTSTERIQAERRYVTTMCRLLAQQQRDMKQAWQTKSSHDCSDSNGVDEQMKMMEESFFQDHPMLPLLLERHQTAAVCGGSGRLGTTTTAGIGVLLADSIISVTLQSMTAASCEKPPLIRRLPLTLTILQVKTMLARHYGLDVDLQQLTFVAAAATATAATTTTAANEEVSNGEHNPTSLAAATNSNPTGLLPTIMDGDEATLGYFGVDDGAVIYMHEIDVAERQLQQTREKAEFDTKLQQQQADWEARLGAEKKEQS